MVDNILKWRLHIVGTQIVLRIMLLYSPILRIFLGTLVLLVRFRVISPPLEQRLITLLALLGPDILLLLHVRQVVRTLDRAASLISSNPGP